MVNIGKRIKRIRLAKGMSQNDVRRACGLFACYISRVENGVTMPSLETLERFAQGFAMPLHDLLYQITFHVPKAIAPDPVTQEDKADGINESSEPETDESKSIQLNNELEGQLPC